MGLGAVEKPNICTAGAPTILPLGLHHLVFVNVSDHRHEKYGLSSEQPTDTVLTYNPVITWGLSVLYFNSSVVWCLLVLKCSSFTGPQFLAQHGQVSHVVVFWNLGLCH